MRFSEQFNQWLESYKAALVRGLDGGAASDWADGVAADAIPVTVPTKPGNVYEGKGEYEIPSVRSHWTAYDYNSRR
jgi:hypothetical protein